MSVKYKPGPPVIGWEITGQCNLSCPHCFSAAARKPRDEMTTAEGREIIEIMADIGVGMIGWTGGEPLLRGDLEGLIAFARGLGIKSHITTNGVLLDERRAKSLKRAGNYAIQISLDGSTPERNYIMRRTTGEEFDKIIEAIRICRKLNMRLFLATLLGAENIDDAGAMVELAKREGLDRIRFCGYTPIGRGKSRSVRERLDFKERMADLLDFIESVQNDNSIMAMFDPGFGPVPPEYRFHKCLAGKETFYLKSNGDLYPCTSLLQRQFRVGNIRERSLSELWNDPAMEKIADLPRDNLDGYCRDCDNMVNCHGACRGAAFAHTGNLQASFPVCLYRAACEMAVSSHKQ